MHSSGSITRKFGPSWKQSTGHTSTQSVYLHLMQFSVTTKVMVANSCTRRWVMLAQRPTGAGVLAVRTDGAPYEVRTRVSAVRGRRPGPLDEGSVLEAGCRRPLL